jgi:hypothetical protein
VAGQRVALTPPDYVDESKIKLNDNSRKVLEKRYLRRDIDGKLLETSAGMFYRIAYHIAQVEKQHNADAAPAAETFYKLLSEYRFFPNSPTFTGAGTPLGQLAACFVLPIEDDMGQGARWHLQHPACGGIDPTNRWRQWLLLQPSAPKGGCCPHFGGSCDRASGIPARLRPSLWGDRPGWVSLAGNDGFHRSRLAPLG